MRILLFGDASGFHATLAKGLKALGHEVVVASHGSYWMDTPRDIDLRRGNGKIGGAILWARISTILSRHLKGYDIVAITNPVLVEQRPNRCKVLFDRLKRDNGAVVLTALGTDTPYVEMCVDPSHPLRYNEWRLPDGSPSPYAVEHPEILQAWLRDPLRDLCRHVYDHVDGVVTALYEYHLSASRWLPASKLAYGGIPVEINKQGAWAPSPAHTKKGSSSPSPARKITLFLGRHRSRIAEKGTDRLEWVVREVNRLRPDKTQVQVVENVPFEQYSRMLADADIVFDQLYSYTPATNALMAMARGQLAVSGGEPEYYQFIGHEGVKPIVNIIPGREQDTVNQLVKLIDSPNDLYDLRVASREFVEAHNSLDVVARRFATSYENILNE
ncbi:MAG: glycosyltransferase family 1 protein [Bacteroidales bacterium]|nr:glycosyltransferase family 1 protein [Bacteroidales bacterium]